MEIAYYVFSFIVDVVSDIFKFCGWVLKKVF